MSENLDKVLCRSGELDRLSEKSYDLNVAAKAMYK